MGWREFEGWLGVMRAQTEPKGVAPDSWSGSESDSWWQQARADRERDRGW